MKTGLSCPLFPGAFLDFTVVLSVDLHTVKPGTLVNFMMKKGADGMYVIHSLTRIGEEQ